MTAYGDGEVAFFSAKRWDHRNIADLIESATPCHDAQVVGSYRVSNRLCQTALTANSKDYTTAPQTQNYSHMNLEQCYQIKIKSKEKWRKMKVHN